MSRNGWPDKTGIGGQNAAGISGQIGRNTQAAMTEAALAGKDLVELDQIIIASKEVA